MSPWVAWEQAHALPAVRRHEPTASYAADVPAVLHGQRLAAPGPTCSRSAGSTPRFRRAEDVELAYRLGPERACGFVFEPRRHRLPLRRALVRVVAANGLRLRRQRRGVRSRAGAGPEVLEIVRASSAGATRGALDGLACASAVPALERLLSRPLRTAASCRRWQARGSTVEPLRLQRPLQPGVLRGPRRRARWPSGLPAASRRRRREPSRTSGSSTLDTFWSVSGQRARAGPGRPVVPPPGGCRDPRPAPGRPPFTTKADGDRRAGRSWCRRAAALELRDRARAATRDRRAHARELRRVHRRRRSSCSIGAKLPHRHARHHHGQRLPPHRAGAPPGAARVAGRSSSRTTSGSAPG